MESKIKSLMPIIEANYASLSPSEQKVADYFLGLEVMTDLSSKAVADRVFVSVATLSRFAEKCGFTGYREFVYAYKSAFTEKDKVAEEKHKVVLGTYQELLNKIYSLADESGLRRIAMKIKESRHVYFAGIGSSGLAAEEIATRFRWLGVDAVFVRDAETMKLQSAFLTGDDIVIGLSISGRKSELRYFMTEGHKRGSHICLVTGTKQDLYDDFCDEVVLVPSIKYLNHGSLISPQFPLLMTGDMLYASYVGLDETAAQSLQEQAQEALYGYE